MTDSSGLPDDEPNDLPPGTLDKKTVDIFGDEDLDDEDDSEWDGSDDGSDNGSDEDGSEDGSDEDGSDNGSDEEEENEEQTKDGEGSPHGGSEASGPVVPIRGYTFPAVHKLVASGDAEGLEHYLSDMLRYAPLGSPTLMPWEMKDLLGRLPLHLALLDCKPELVNILLKFDRDHMIAREGDLRKYSTVFRRLDDFPCMHLALAAAPWRPAEALEMLSALFDHPGGAEIIAEKDATRKSLLHVATTTGRPEVVEWVASRAADQLTMRDDHGYWPLHCAIDGKQPNLVMWFFEKVGAEALLKAAEEELSPERHPFLHCVAKSAWECMHALLEAGESMDWTLPQPAIDLAESLGVSWELETICLANDRKEGLERVLARHSSPTGIVYDTDCLGHVALPTESQDGHVRLKRIAAIPENPTRLEVIVGPFGALNHDEFTRRLRRVEGVRPCATADILRVHEWSYIRELEEAAAAAEEGQLVPLDGGDTKISSQSWLSALKAASCVVQAVDLVMSEACRNAFAAVRPPGHHVGMRGAVDRELEDSDRASKGFCLLNNVAIGAAYALNVHRHSIGRVAIVDFDIHHGNGTEALVRGLAGPKVTRIPLRGLGLSGVIETHQFAPWFDRTTDKDSVFFASIHRHDGKFYPYTGASSVDGNVVNVGLSSGSTSEDLRDGLSRVIIPKLLEFAPDLIFVSAGFDGHNRDRLAAGECDFSEEDFYWMTEQLMGVAQVCAKGRLVSVLEGGYNTRAGWLSPLSQSVAAHVRALCSSGISRIAGIGSIDIDDEDDDDVLNEEHDPVAKRRRMDDEEAELFGTPAGLEEHFTSF